MSKIYIILTFTGTWLSRTVRFFTKDEYCHVSISLDKNLNEMYSFGRIHAYNPVSAGFVHEKVHSGTFKRFKNTKAIIYEINVTDNQYKLIKSKIKEIELKKDIYHFNMIGLVAVKFNKKIVRKNKFYCAEFVKYVIDEADINLNLPDLIKPSDFINIKTKELIYKGILRNYI